MLGKSAALPNINVIVGFLLLGYAWATLLLNEYCERYAYRVESVYTLIISVSRLTSRRPNRSCHRL
jgi:hypothetical protein